MSEKGIVDSRPSPAADLRREAEQRFHDQNTPPAEGTAGVDARALVHELQVHQIELEMQNEELRLAQAAVQEMSDQYRDLFDFAPIGYFRLDGQGRILENNLAGAALLGLDQGTAVKQRFGQYVAIESRARFAELLRDALQADRRQAGEIEFQRNERRWSAVVEAAPAHDGRADDSLRVIVTDITDRKRAEQEIQRLNAELAQRIAEQTAEIRAAYEAARAEQRRLYCLLETLPACVVLLSADYHVQFANRVFRERFGEPHGKRCFEHLFQRTEPCAHCESCRVLKTDENNHREWTGPDGRHYDVHDQRFVDMDGSNSILKMLIDTTDHRESQRALKASEARYRSFVSASTQIIWITDAQGLVVGDLPSWRAFTGQSIEQIQGWGWIDALHPDDRERTAAVWSQAVATRSVYTVEYRMRRHDSEYRWLSVRGIPVVADGTIREWVGACTDITDRKRAEEETLHAREELARFDRIARMGELTSSLAHELNQPLTAILSNAQAARRLLATHTPDGELFCEILDDIIRDDKRAGSVIHRLRLMLQKERQETERFAVNHAVREVVQLLHSEIIGRHVAVSMDLVSGLPDVWAHRIEVQQVIVNLLLNALHAVKDLPPDRRAILIRTHLDEGAVAVAIRDRGSGIQFPEVNRIFEPFFTTKPGGLGMGLAICRHILEAHGGRIWAANNEDTGATVSFSLPSPQARQGPRDG